MKETITITGPNDSDPSEIERIARIHENAPLDWVPGYQPDAPRIAELASYLREVRGEADVCILVARNEEQEMVGFHWLTLEKKDDTLYAHINSLWVDEAYRGAGIAKRLKMAGERWAREAGATLMLSEVCE